MKRLIPSGLMLAFILSALVIVTPTTTNGQGAGLVSSVLNRMEKNRADFEIVARRHQHGEIQFAARR